MTATARAIPAADTLNLEEAAAFLHLGIEATRELFERGELPGVSLNQKHAVFLRRDLDAYLHNLALQQQATRRAGRPTREHVAAPPRRRRGQLPNLDAAEAKAAALDSARQ